MKSVTLDLNRCQGPHSHVLTPEHPRYCGLSELGPWGLVRPRQILRILFDTFSFLSVP
jgi:hypothetical protein